MLLVWVVAGGLTWFGASICAELASAYPRTGGVYVFLREMFSPAAGFLWGWAMFWSMHSGIIAAIAMVFGRYAATIVPMGDARHPRSTAVWRDRRAVRRSTTSACGRAAALQTALTIAKVAAVALLLVAAVGCGAPCMRGRRRRSCQPRGVLPRSVAGLFAFGGWHMVTYAAERDAATPSGPFHAR